MESASMDFWKVIYENVRKKAFHKNVSVYLCHRHFEVS